MFTKYGDEFENSPIDQEITDPTIIYNGEPEVYEDIADYLPLTSYVKAVRLG